MKTFMKFFKKAIKWFALIEFVIYPAIVGYSEITNWFYVHGAWSNYGELRDKCKAGTDYFHHEIGAALKITWRSYKGWFKVLKKRFKKEA